MANTKNNWVIIDGKRYNLASMTDLELSDSKWATGVSLEAVYLMPKSKKVIMHTYSFWENRQTHGVQGDHYKIADEWEILQLADIFGDERLMELAPNVIPEEMEYSPLM